MIKLSKHILKTISLLSILFLFSFQTKASHLSGGEITYKCLGAGQYQITVKLYRNCSGIPLCNCPGMLGCNLNVIGTMVVKGADSNCSNLPAAPTMPIDTSSHVNGFDVVQLCRTEKTLCTNCGTRTPGTFSTGIEVYTFTGTINLNNVSPVGCCNVVIGWTNCCRNGGITTLQSPDGLSYYIETLINRCAMPCNSTPVFTNPPVVAVCAGQEYTYNIGAIDPDGDSLSYAFSPTLLDYNNPAPYKAPYNAKSFPFPYLGSPKYFLPRPLGIGIDSITGDVHFVPTGNFIANMVIEVTEWRNDTITFVPYKVGITRRDVQIYSKSDCPPNNPPKMVTYKESGELISSTKTYTDFPNPIPVDYVPKTNWLAKVNEQLCFIIEARDDKANTDTTDMMWNAPPTITNSVNGTYSFTPTYARDMYPSSNDHIGVQFYDKWKFCWTPTIDAYHNSNKRPYYFTVSSNDRMCPISGRTFITFAIRVHSDFDSTSRIDEKLSESIKLYPNPTSNNTLLELVNMANWQISINDINGKTLRVYKAFKGKELIIQKEDLKAGLYLVNIKNMDSNKSNMIKLLIE